MSMDRNSVIAALRAHEPEFRAAGVLSISLFGSVALGDALDNSDIDLAVRLSDGFSHGGFDYFGQLDELEARLTQILGHKVDVVEEPVRKKRFQTEIDKDRVFAF